MQVQAHVDVDVVAVESDDEVTVMVELVAPTLPKSQDRTQQGVVVVLDRSGSMGGGRLESAKRALHEIATRLDSADRFAVVTFDDSAQVVVPAAANWAEDREGVHAAIDAIRTGGMTDLSSGYLRGLQEAERMSVAGGVTIMLLSDGHANSGVTDPTQLRSLAQTAAKQQVTTATIGIGEGYDENILSEMALGGHGNHTFALDGDSAAGAVSAEVDGLLDKSVQAASMRITASHEVQAIQVLNDLPMQMLDDGVLIELGDFYSREQRRLLCKVKVPQMAGLGLAQVAVFTLTFVALPDLEQHQVSLPISVNVVPKDVADGRVPNPEVQREALIQEVQELKRASEAALAEGRSQEALDTLTKARGRLHAAKAPRVQEIADELAVVEESIRRTNHSVAFDEPDHHTSKRLRASRMQMSRGYRRGQGGIR